MAQRLEFFFDYGSPYSYFADTQLPGLIERTGCEVAYRPMLLGGVFKSVGSHSPAAEPVEAKRRHFAVELRRSVAHYGVPFESPPGWPINTLQIMRTAHAAQREGVFDAFHQAVYTAFWGSGKAIGDLRVFASILREAGLPAEALLAASLEPDVKTELRDTTEEAVERGAFGAPTFFLDEEMFFGADRIPYIEKILT
ncbi:MAG: 2-hydroxychromene-2-carboxylate isomerase [Candidatus Binatia bacterium]|nr:2-hydroxychromene-2-carboxylate isomerase [Candidatus Binatia bacterium]MDG2008693.1 2-hydroxychromene-2-carboxylate isomerase [Candidatus Binatia bacterium]